MIVAVVKARGVASMAAARTRFYATTPQPQKKLILGCGSNVMDVFFNVRKLPLPGDKAYYADESIVAKEIVGGVTLNHLSWARIAGAPTGLMALEGTEAYGLAIRAQLESLGVSTKYIRVSSEYRTSVSNILSGPDGERTILMAPASTSRLNAVVMAREFASAIATEASMVTTEVSQVPLSGVEFLLDAARAARIPCALDVDVPPSIATGPAQLGTMDELRRVVQKATIVKLTASAAEELLALVSPSSKLETSLAGVAQQLANALSARVCVVTDGSRGSALALGRTSGGPCGVHAGVYAGVTQRDATGAGDAFFGGLIAGVHAWGMPANEAELKRLGNAAAAAGAACVEVLGALPVPGVSDARLVSLNADYTALVEAGKNLSGGAPPPSRVSASASGASSRAQHNDPTAASAAAFASYSRSLAADADALSSLVAAAGSADGTFPASLATLARAIACCSSLERSTPHVLVTGIGKSGAVASRLAISLRSLGIRAGWVHGNEWHHGDFGAAGPGDLVIALSHSGRTAELIDVAARLTARGVGVASITGNASSPLARASNIAHLHAPASNELLGVVPTRSICAQEAVANALLSVVADALCLTKEGFQKHHPGGSIGGGASR